MLILILFRRQILRKGPITVESAWPNYYGGLRERKSGTLCAPGAIMDSEIGVTAP